MIFASAEAVSSHYFGLFFNRVEFLVKNYIAHDAVQKITPIS